MITEELIWGNEYKLPNGSSAFYQGIERLKGEQGEFLKFISQTPAPDCFRFSYVPVDNSRLRKNQIISERGVVYRETREMPQIPRMQLEESMRQLFQRFGTGAIQ